MAQLALDYMDSLAEELTARAARAVGMATVIGYRCGLDFDPSRPSRGAVIAAANRRLSDPKEPLSDPILLRYLLWTAVDVARERGLPVQFHAGFGDPDHGFHPGLHRTDPARMTTFVKALQQIGVPVVLLHCYPFHRQAAYLASVFPHVYVDVGLALTHSAAGSARIMDELLERVPFHKQLFGSDCHGVAETGHLGALYFRRALAATLKSRLDAGEWSAADAARVGSHDRLRQCPPGLPALSSSLGREPPRPRRSGGTSPSNLWSPARPALSRGRPPCRRRAWPRRSAWRRPARRPARA